ncbi:MAG: hypothetical protein ABSC23_12930 [Bryobacteraceae bacterium]|jgi:hypothetical protein
MRRTRHLLKDGGKRLAEVIALLGLAGTAIHEVETMPWASFYFGLFWAMVFAASLAGVLTLCISCRPWRKWLIAVSVVVASVILYSMNIWPEILDSHIHLSIECDTVNLPMPYRGDIWQLDTLFLKGLTKYEPNPLASEEYWPEKGVRGSGFRCVVKNFGADAVSGVTISAKADKKELVRTGVNGTGWSTGKILETFKPVIFVPETLRKEGQNGFTFYVCNYDPDRLIDIEFPQSALVNGANPGKATKVPIEVASPYGGSSLFVSPTRRD